MSVRLDIADYYAKIIILSGRQNFLSKKPKMPLLAAANGNQKPPGNRSKNYFILFFNSNKI